MSLETETFCAQANDMNKGEMWDLNEMDPQDAEALCVRTEMEDHRFQQALKAKQTKGSASSRAKSQAKGRCKSSSTSPARCVTLQNCAMWFPHLL